MKTFTQFLQEVSTKNLNRIPHDKKTEDLNMKQAFGNKLRIAISLDGHENPTHSFIRLFKDATQHQLTQQELKDGTVTTQTHTKEGTKSRTTTIGKFLTKHKRTDLLNAYATLKDNLKNQKDEQYSIIISRAPIDLLRMSDHTDDSGKSIQSCHSPNNSHFHCAIQEAKTGGAIAYAILTKDLENANLQAKELFADQTRNTKGITPLERIRLRRFTHDNTELLIPEIRSYPARGNGTSTHIPGFKEAVTKWAKDAQSQTLQNINPQQDFKKYNLRGGNYQDNSASDLWNNFFQTQTQGKKTSLDQKDRRDKEEEHHMTAGEWTEEARHSLRQHTRRWTYGDNYDITYEGAFDASAYNDAQGEWAADLEFQIPNEQFTSQPTDSHTLTDQLTDHIKNLHVYPASIRLNQDDKHLIVTLTLDSDSNQRNERTLTDFEHFLDEITEIDIHYHTITEFIIAFFAHQGNIHSDALTLAKEAQFKNFTISLNSPDGKSHDSEHYHITSTEMPLGSFIDYPKIRPYLSFANNTLLLPFNRIPKPKPPLPYYVTLEQDFNFTLYKEKDIRHYQPSSYVTGTPIEIPFRSALGAYFSSSLAHNTPAKQAQDIIDNIKKLDDHFTEFQTSLQKWWTEYKAAVNKYHHDNPE
jgi:hypothetical protein